MATHPHHYLASWPAWASRWLGYRSTVPPKPPNYVIWIWSFVGAFCGLSVLQAVFGQAQYFIERGVPSLVASFGASAVLCYGAVEAPFSQPRALVGGQFLSALVGVCINKLFGLLRDPERIARYQWLDASLSTAAAVVVMQITETTHPPAGATALLPAVDQAIGAIGWYYLPVVLLSSMLILMIALLVNNIQRRYPVFWFKPARVINATPEPALGGPQQDGQEPSVSPEPKVANGVEFSPIDEQRDTQHASSAV